MFGLKSAHNEGIINNDLTTSMEILKFLDKKIYQIFFDKDNIFFLIVSASILFLPIQHLCER